MGEDIYDDCFDDPNDKVAIKTIKKGPGPGAGNTHTHTPNKRSHNSIANI